MKGSLGISTRIGKNRCRSLKDKKSIIRKVNASLSRGDFCGIVVINSDNLPTVHHPNFSSSTPSHLQDLPSHQTLAQQVTPPSSIPKLLTATMHSLSLLRPHPTIPLPLTLSLPNPVTSPDTGAPLAGNTGIDTGISITMYRKPNCDKSSNVQTVELQYNQQVAQEFHSYRLNGTFSDDQKVSIFAPADWKAEGRNGVEGGAVGNVGIGVS